jgi:hypothetical protein
MQKLLILSATMQPKAGGASRTVKYAVPDSEWPFDGIEKVLSELYPAYDVVSLRFVTQARLLEI